jgi:hypothetical protein
MNLRPALISAFVIFTTTSALFAATFTVTTTADNGDNGTPTPGSLRAAILASNASTGVPDLIDFDIPGSGLHTIIPPSALPTITDPVVIDGYADHGDGASENTNPVGQGLNTVLKIELNGTNAGVGVSGLTLTGGNSTIRGLVINRFDNVGINLNSATNLVAGNFIGTNAAGTAALGNGGQAVRVDSQSDNTIGGTTPAARNLISGNDEGMEIRGTGADRTIVRGNLIGTNAAGTGALGNVTNGVRIADGIGNIVGGTASGARNVISANQGVGVTIRNSNATGSFVQGNYIGTDVTGAAALGNVGRGVSIDNSPGNMIGGSTSGAGNLISGNNDDGVFITGASATMNVVQGNFIGADVNGTADLGNAFNGVRIAGAQGNTIGGTTAAARNVISGNDENGLGINSGASGNQVQGNFIGTDVNGTAALGNTNVGVYIFNAPTNTIGGTASGAGNVISGNGLQGVVIDTSGSTGNLVQGNFIGTDVNGTAALGNSDDGVSIQDAPSNTIGGAATGAGNLISGNDDDGIFISGATATNNAIEGNLIGTKANGIDALGNANDGIDFSSSSPASNNYIGGTSSGEPNTIAFNGARGVFVSGGTGNRLLSNSIFSNGGLGIDLEDDGVTPNDAGDSDTGANNMQNFPVLTSASSGGGNTTINGSLNSAASTTFRIEFFASAAADPTTFGEGQTFLGFKVVTTNGSGNAAFAAVLPVLPPAGETIISSTATDPSNNTSEFSNVVQIGGTAGQLLNISTRGRVLTGDNVMIGGFIITGIDAKKVIIRAIGPQLGNANPPVPDALANPTLALHDQNRDQIDFNDDWGDRPEPERTEIANFGFLEQPESAMIKTLTPGAYTAIMRGKNDTIGVGLVEIYDLSPNSNSTLTNISTRGFVDTGDNVLIGGLIVGGGGGGSAKVIVRAIGPELTAYGVPNVLADPTLELHDGNGALLVVNDNWKDTQQTEIEATGLAPTNDVESAIVFFAPPGNTTAIMRGKNNTTGNGLVEVYALP